mgnify:CR=1 FL=1
MGWFRKERGAEGEDAAALALRKAGYVILERNISLGGGELDLVAKEGGEIVFIEVKARSTKAFGSAAEAVNSKKALRMAKAARAYLASRKLDNAPSRADVVAVELDGEGRAANVEIVRGCLDLSGALAGRRWRM